MEEKIVYIPREKLFAHPNNPRKVLGDCAEMADSIRSMGILQPLVVVRYDPSQHPEIKNAGDDCYVTIIGHRRRKGGMMAGIEAYPAIVKEMSLSEQIGTMLVENGNREDLTHQEEAQAIQQMLDLGENLESVCAMTGFSKETVRKRRKLLDLDQDKLAQAELRGATLADYAKLDEIRDPELKNMVLDSIGTNNFDAELKRAKDLQKRKEAIQAYIPKLQAFAQRVMKPNEETMLHIGNYSWDGKKKVEEPSDLDQTAYYFVVKEDQIDLYRERNEEDDTEAMKAEIAAQERTADVERRNSELEEMALRAYELRSQFIHDIPPVKVKKHFGMVVGFLGEFLMNTANANTKRAICTDPFLLGNMLGFQVEPNGSFQMDAYKESANRVPEYNLLVTTYTLVDSNQQLYHQLTQKKETDMQEIKHIENSTLDKLYAFLCELGYTMSDEEKAYQSGSHALFMAAQNPDSKHR